MVFLQAEFWAFSTGSGSCWAGYKKALQKWHRGTDREEQTERKNREEKQREKAERKEQVEKAEIETEKKEGVG